MCEYTKSTVNKSTWKYLDYRMKVESTAQEGLLTMRWYPGSSWCTVLVYPHDILVRLHNTLHIVYHYLCTKYCSLDTYCITVLCLQSIGLYLECEDIIAFCHYNGCCIMLTKFIVYIKFQYIFTNLWPYSSCIGSISSRAVWVCVLHISFEQLALQFNHINLQ